MSRIGKIARLPKAIRDELNRRLEDGEPGNRLVEWLNAREDVQAVLKGGWDGRPINAVNLTHWRQGGYEEWRRTRETFEIAGRLVGLRERRAAGSGEATGLRVATTPRLHSKPPSLRAGRPRSQRSPISTPGALGCAKGAQVTRPTLEA